MKVQQYLPLNVFLRLMLWEERGPMLREPLLDIVYIHGAMMRCNVTWPLQLIVGLSGDASLCGWGQWLMTAHHFSLNLNDRQRPPKHWLCSQYRLRPPTQHSYRAKMNIYRSWEAKTHNIQVTHNFSLHYIYSCLRRNCDYFLSGYLPFKPFI